MNISELLFLRGLDASKHIKLVRHQDNRYDVSAKKMYQVGALETYQCYQARQVFDCDFIASFIGLERSKAMFIGVYQVLGKKTVKQVGFPKGYPYPLMVAGANYVYQLKKCEGYDDLIDRVIILWDGVASQWCRNMTGNEEVLEILPRGRVREFPGFHDFILDYPDLCTLIRNPDPNREWYVKLSSVAGVYLVVDTKTGKQYVGSAYGKNGIWGRWESYAKTSGHGNNDLLIELIRTDTEYANKYFQFSILCTLDRSLTDKEVLAKEAFFKRKLGSRAFGLNH